MPENIHEKSTLSPTELILYNYVQSEQNLQKLLKGDKQFTDKIKPEIQGLKIVDSNELVKTIFESLGREDDKWDQDRRDGALEILKLVDFEKVPYKVYETYVECVKKQAEIAEPDVYGSISSLLEGGKILAAKVATNPGDQSKVYWVWSDLRTILEKKLQRTDYGLRDDKYIQGETEKLIALMQGNRQEPRALAEETQEEVFHDRREMPELDKDCRFLYNNYIEVTKRQSTYKLFLWENVPQFRQLCNQYGLQLERFWNLNNPQEIAQAITVLKQQPSELIKTVFAKTLKQTTGLDLVSAPEEQIKVVADEVIKAAFLARQEIIKTTQSQDLESLRTKFAGIIEQTKAASPKGRAKLIKPILQFLEEHGQEVADLKDLDKLASFLTSDTSMAMVKQSFEGKQQQKKGMAQALSLVFNLDGRKRNIALASREKNDLYLGDLTGDCTAFHLHTGMNAWTVPVWLSNPGFNFFKISDENDQLVAKFGLLLALKNGQPALVIDSVETSKNISDPEKAKQQIMDGFQELKHWANTINLQDVFLKPFSNSSELHPLLESIIQKSEEVELEALGGLKGVAELRSKLGGGEVDEKIYLQSAHDIEESTEDIEKLEEVIRKTIEIAPKEKKQEIEELVEKRQWDGLFAAIIELNYSEVGKVLGKDYHRYLSMDLPITRYLQDIIDEEMIRLFGHRESEQEYYRFKARKPLAGYEEKDFALFRSRFHEDLPAFDGNLLDEQAANLELKNLIPSLQRINEVMPFERAMEILYGKSVSRNSSLLLALDIPRLSL